MGTGSAQEPLGDVRQQCLAAAERVAQLIEENYQLRLEINRLQEEYRRNLEAEIERTVIALESEKKRTLGLLAECHKLFNEGLHGSPEVLPTTSSVEIPEKGALDVQESTK